MNVQQETVKREDAPDFGAILRAAHLAGLAVKITENCGGPRHTFTRMYPACQIIRIVEEPRRGTVIVLDDLHRVKVRRVTAVMVMPSEEVPIERLPQAMLSSGDYYTERGQHFGTLRIVPPNERT